MNDMSLTLDEIVTLLKEATKISLAANVAKLVVDPNDEDGNPRDQDLFQEDINAVFFEVMEDFDRTLGLLVQRAMEVKAQGTGISDSPAMPSKDVDGFEYEATLLGEDNEEEE